MELSFWHPIWWYRLSKVDTLVIQAGWGFGYGPLGRWQGPLQLCTIAQTARFLSGYITLWTTVWWGSHFPTLSYSYKVHGSDLVIMRDHYLPSALETGLKYKEARWLCRRLWFES